MNTHTMMTRSKMYRSKMTQADMTQTDTLQNQFDDQNRNIQFILGVNTIWTSAIVVMALRSQFVMLLLKIYLAINLAYNYNPFVIGINIFNRINTTLCFVYKMADDFMWKRSLEPEEEEDVDTDSQMSSAEEEIRYKFSEEEDTDSSSEEEDNDSSSEEEDNDSSSDYEEWVFKRPCKKADATKADATKADATKADATKADATETYENDADDEADDLSPLFTCSVCEISTRNPYVKFVVFCGKEYCGTCSTKALYTTPLNEVDDYLLSEYKKHDGWYDPETSTFHIGFWINNEFVPIMDDIRNIHKYSNNKEEDADCPKEDADCPKEDADCPKEDADCPKEDADCPKEDADSPKEDADCPKEDADSPKEDAESSEEEDNDSSSDYADDDYMKYIPKDLVFPEDKAEDNVKSEETSSDDFNIHDFSEIL